MFILLINLYPGSNFKVLKKINVLHTQVILQMDFSLPSDPQSLMLIVPLKNLEPVLNNLRSFLM